MDRNFREDYQNLHKEIIERIASAIDENGIINYHGDNVALNTSFTALKDCITVWYVYKRKSKLGYDEVAVDFELESTETWDYARNLPVEVLLTIVETLDDSSIYDNDD